jgi:hypothetical protein
METLVQRHGLQLDPADIPHPADEIIAKVRERQRQARRRSAGEEAAA